MRKYDFINIGAKVEWDMFNDGNHQLMQVCTLPTLPIRPNSKIGLIGIQQKECLGTYPSELATAEELLPHIEEFNKGYWCAIQDAVANGASDDVICDMLNCAGFSFWECQYLMNNSDFQADRLKVIIQQIFCQTPDLIDYNGAIYPTKRLVLFAGTSNEEEVLVSVERLENQLLDDAGIWSCREAEEIDEMFYFYLNEEVFNYPDKDIVEFLEDEI